MNRDNRAFISDFHSLEELEELLDPQQYFRANRQQIIRLDAVEGYRSSYNGKLDVKMKGPVAEEVSISREKAGQFKEWFG